MWRIRYEIRYYFCGSSEADFVKEIVKEVKWIIASIGFGRRKRYSFRGKGESLRTAFSMYECFSIIIKMLGHRLEPLVPGDPQDDWEDQGNFTLIWMGLTKKKYETVTKKNMNGACLF